MAPSSAMEKDPSRAYSPPITQTARKIQVVGRYFAISPGVRRIPAPMVLPMMTARPKPTPKMRSRVPREAVASCRLPVASFSGVGFWSEDRELSAGARLIPSLSPRLPPKDSRAVAAHQRLVHFLGTLRAVERRYVAGFSLSHRRGKGSTTAGGGR